MDQTQPEQSNWTDPERHRELCERAGCQHPPTYDAHVHGGIVLAWCKLCRAAAVEESRS